MDLQNLQKQAEKIAQSMYAKGLYPWHVNNELENCFIPAMYRKQLENKTKMELSRLREKNGL